MDIGSALNRSGVLTTVSPMPKKLQAAKRSRIVTLLGEGLSVRAISRETRAARATIDAIKESLALGEDPSLEPALRKSPKPARGPISVLGGATMFGQRGSQQCMVIDIRYVVPVEHANLSAAFETLGGPDRRISVISAAVFPGSLAEWDAQPEASEAHPPRGLRKHDGIVSGPADGKG